MPPLIRDKEGNKSINAVLIAITVICLLSVIPFCLFDISLITDVPVIGRCIYPESVLRSSANRFILLLLLLFNLQLAVTFYVHIRSKGRSCCNLYVAWVVVIFMILVSLTITITSAEVLARFTDCIRPIRGSYCILVPSDSGIVQGLVLFSSVFFFAVPLVLNVVFIVLTCVRVLTSVVELDRRVVQSMIVFLIIMTLATLITRIPAFVLQIFNSTGNSDYDVATLIALQTTKLSIPLFLCLILALHKRVRQFYLDRLKKVFHLRCSRRIMAARETPTPAVSPTTSVSFVSQSTESLKR